MPDSLLGLRPVVRRVSATQKDIINRFETRSSSTSSSVSNSGTSTPTGLISRSRTGSIKKTSLTKTKSKTERDLMLETKVIDWIDSVINERPDGDYESFIRDGVVLSKVMTSIVFNSVPMEDIAANWGANPALDRAKSLIREIRRYGVIEVFEAEDLLELRDIPKVTKCIAQLSKLAASDKDNLLNRF